MQESRSRELRSLTHLYTFLQASLNKIYITQLRVMMLMRCIILCSVFCSYAWSFQCPQHERKFAPTVCQCDAGYSRQGGICLPCPAGTFKEYAGDSAENDGACLITTGSKGCCKCNINTNTLDVAAVHSSLCVCVPGHSGAACRPCPIGSYKRKTSNEHCNLCPQGTTTEQDASRAREQCVQLTHT